ncbi:ABC transporter substrate-binding protein [Sinomonas terrae]|uniref:Extracellular solute-binding protein n=1 Tax=Sinomonas terrae TaxID=2908838 RepID=A0ABS9U222_9MICC|nr:extracellular solute-binding protein [Sinomonas terrae]MCH6470743.1 extracellular solute-binding protein [Sinomonas terrae]
MDAQSSAWNDIVKKANDEGSLTLYTSMGQENAEPKLYAAFKKAYPNIKINLTFLATGDLINKLNQELSGQVKGADAVMHASPGWFADTYKANQFAALQVSPDNQAAGWDKLLNGKSYATWWGFQYVLGYSKSQPTPPADLKALLDANPQAKIGLVSPKASQAAANVYETLRQTYGDGFLDQLAKARYTVYNSNSELSAAFGAGAVDYAYPDQVNTTAPLIAKGAQVAQLVTKNARAGANYNVAVMLNAPHPNAAQVWANFVMSKDGQEAIVQDNAPAGTVPTNVPGAAPWDQVNFLDPSQWTNDKWNAWIAKYWTPRFK